MPLVGHALGALIGHERFVSIRTNTHSARVIDASVLVTNSINDEPHAGSVESNEWRLRRISASFQKGFWLNTVLYEKQARSGSLHFCPHSALVLPIT